MRSPEILSTDTRKRKRQKASKFKYPKSVEILQNGFLKEDDSSSCCSEASCQDSDSVVSNEPEVGEHKKTSIFAIDCEMVGVGDERKSALARCSIVDYEGNVIYDTFVKPEAKITDYRTQWSGIRSSDMEKAIPFRKARRRARKLLKDRVLVGHSLQSDLNVLKLKHPHHCIRDTSKFIPLRTMAGLPSGATPSLKNLTRNLLQTEIQTSEHCSIEDARASLSLYKLCENDWENEWKEVDSSSYLCDVYWPSWTKTN